MDTKHTPAPWAIETENVNSDLINIVTDSAFICSLPSNLSSIHVEPREQAEANAKLIAAAPTMLEALKSALIDTEMLLNEECEFCPDNLLATIHTLQEAILKATKQ